MTWWMWLLAYGAGAIAALLITSWIAWTDGEDPLDVGYVYGVTAAWPLVLAGIIVIAPFVGLFVGARWITKPRAVRRKEREKKAAEAETKRKIELERLEREAGLK